ncbi:Glucose-1,6-bisphosphate synthase [Gordonia neofelifaecis NRRL B-59395]|uniref:Glucose-1,6-bisphosphate synthase n=1 Tax=Gordonia neofelifaecis NRRL B-59395 TaxID=644548 RepID=F1YFZ4_9ACTN|nr:phospho-sugar mutase [Gordonia neofelifaecis]EGD56571.1 Glucose-1,6-bisphosphate synthase [Gordonia neofelifaecis NRRL B-59395]
MLTFGTAGLRGPVQPGPDGMNVETVTRATAGLADWLITEGATGAPIVVGRDARHGSEDFAAATREVLAAKGFDVIALPDPGPTPLVAFATRHLRAAAGVMITASHNPARDNGYKVYLGGARDGRDAAAGAQLVSPADREIEAAITAVGPAATVPRLEVEPDPRAAAVADGYLSRLTERFAGDAAHPLRIALTPMHGVGGDLALRAFSRCGFDDVRVVDEQFRPDPDFPTVAFPNPEEPGATDRLLALADRTDADLAVALDPDADRCAVGVRDVDGWRMLTGDETGALLGVGVLDRVGPGGPPTVIASSIVSGTLLHAAALRRGADARRTLTGFKWLVRAGEPLVYAYEEALGHCVDPHAVRDKDGVSAAIACAFLASRWSDRGGLVAALDALHRECGVHLTAPRSLRLDDPADIAAIMADLRSSPPRTLGGIPVTAVDYAARTDGLRTDGVELTGSGADGVAVRVFVRPSGTEPKLKFYGQVSAPPAAGSVSTVRHRLSQLLAEVLAELPSGPRGEECGR